MMTKDEKLAYVRGWVSRPALFESVAEEAAELAQAALKVARFYRRENPTPVGYVDAMKKVMEEAADLKLVLDALSFEEWAWDMDTYNKKLDRWLMRIQEYEDSWDD